MKVIDKDLMIISEVIDILSHKTHYRRRLIDLVIMHANDLSMRKRRRGDRYL
jgi:hypothetical protein